MSIAVTINTQVRRALLDLQRASWIPVVFRNRILRHLGASIHPTAKVSHSVTIKYPALLTLGPWSHINIGCVLDGEGRISLDGWARLGVGATIITSTHTIGSEHRRRGPTSTDVVGDVSIGWGCWVGAGACILPGVTIAEGCVIGATALVVRGTAPNGVYVNKVSPSGFVYAQRARDLPGGRADADESSAA